MNEDRRRAAAELGVALATLVVWVASKGQEWHIHFIIAAIVAWMVYCAVRLRRDFSLWSTWGLATPLQGWHWYAGFTLIAVGLVVAASIVRPTPLPALPMIVFPIYFLWAFAQEFAVQNVLVASLATLGVPRRFLPPLVGLLFALGHAPAWPLAALAFCGGIAWTWTFQRHPNLWLLATSHSIVGAAAIILLLGNNPVGGFYGVPLR